MKQIIIITPSNIELVYRLAGVGSRLGAFIIDFFIQLLLILLSALIILLGIDRGLVGNTTPSGTALGIFIILIFVIHFGYFIICELTMNGRTWGKRVFGLRVIRDNGQPIQFVHSLVRGMIRTSVDMLYIGVFVIMFSKQHKRLGDILAGTIVISENYDTLDTSPIEETIPDFLAEYEPIMTYYERQLIFAWLNKKASLPDGGKRLEIMFKDHFKWKSNYVGATNHGHPLINYQESHSQN